MYTSFFGLNEKPFSITPDPRYLYMSERHAEALAHLIYGVKESGGFIQLTGEVGTGKTTLVRSLLQQLPDFADVAVVLNSQLSRVEFLSVHLRRTAYRGPGAAQQHQGVDGRPQCLPSQESQPRPAHHTHRRRSPEPARGCTRTGSPAHQPRDGQAEAAADHPDRPARTPGAARRATTCGSSPSASRVAITWNP